MRNEMQCKQQKGSREQEDKEEKTNVKDKKGNLQLTEGKNGRREKLENKAGKPVFLR